MNKEELIDDALARVTEYGTVGAMKWLAEAIIERATEAGTPAKATIDTLEFEAALLAYVRVLHRSKGLSEYGQGKRAFIEHIDQHAAARAEEARREVLKQLPQEMQNCTILFKQCAHGHGWLTATNWVQHGCPTCEADDLRAALVAAQRTAGGDAVAWAAGRSMHADITTSTETAQVWRERGIRVEALGYLAAQPVAEAAAQADDNIEAMLDEEENPMPAAPTAQPTLHKLGCHLKTTPEFSSCACFLAQPTLPDDERAAFEEWAELAAAQMAGTQHDLIGWYYFDDLTNDRWEAWQARAALRQPSVPDVGEKHKWYVAKANRVERVDGGLLVQTYIPEEAKFIADALNFFTNGATPNPDAEDAARYRWLREHTVLAWNRFAPSTWRSGAMLDRIIDAARAAALRAKQAGEDA